MPLPRSKRLRSGWHEWSPWLLVVLLASCAAPVERPDVGAIPQGRLDAFLLAPTTGYGVAVPPESAAALERAYLGLVRGTGAEEALAVALALEGDPVAGPPAVVLAAQARFELGRCASSLEPLGQVVERFPQYLAALLVLGRCQEEMGDLPGAAGSYQRISRNSSLAAARLSQLAPAAARTAVDRIRGWLAAGRVEEAREALEALLAWAPRDEASLVEISHLAESLGDGRLALTLLRELTVEGRGDKTLRQRRATLEFEVGDAGMGLRILEELVAAYPDDRALGSELETARFAWRLTMLPDRARGAASSPELDRGELATLLYWVFPSVRYGRPPAEAVIASDVLDHEDRAEIVRVVNLGIMSIDPNLHAFRPDVAAQRLDVLRALLRVLAQSPQAGSCLGGATVVGDLSLESACALAAQCGVLPEVADCLPQATLSGASAMAMARRAASRLELQ